MLESATLVFRYKGRKGIVIHVYGMYWAGVQSYGTDLRDDIFRLSDNWIESSEGMKWEEKNKE